MLTALWIITVFFTWLILETDFFTIRLYMGTIPDHSIRKAWADLKADAEHLPARYQPFWLKFPENMSPLCGLEWLENTMHVIPEYKFEIFAYGLHSTITLKNPDTQILKELAAALLKPNKQERAALTEQRKQSRKARKLALSH